MSVTGTYLGFVPELGSTRLDDSVKAIPLGASLALEEVPAQGWNVARGDLPFPVLTLGASALTHNIATMRSYCERHGVALAPHGKTTMSPQLFAAQIAAGAWGMTAATPTQAAVMIRYGVRRVILANELVDAGALRRISARLDADPGLTFLCLVDSLETVGRMEELLADAGAARRLSVLIEVGCHGGRAGVRSVDEACAVAAAVAASARLTLAGVEAFEGVVAAASDAELAAGIDAMLAMVRQSVVAIAGRGLFPRDREVIVTAGGSMYFDRVIDVLAEWPGLGVPISLVLRSGCYVSHDGGTYEARSPLGGHRPADESLTLLNALTLWASVLSRPEPDTLIVGAGLRDAPVDRSLPRPRAVFRDGSQRLDLSAGPPDTAGSARAESFRVMDQHTFIRIDPDLEIRTGDVMTFDLSHPCTAFDKFRFIPLIDADADVVDAVLTFF